MPIEEDSRSKRRADGLPLRVFQTADENTSVFIKMLELILRLKGNYLWPAIHARLFPFGSKSETEFGGDLHLSAEGSKRFAN